MKRPNLLGNQNAAKPERLRRVVLVAQRVEPRTLAELKRRAKRCGGIGRAIDAAVSAGREG